MMAKFPLVTFMLLKEPAVTASRPHVVLILADDHGPWAMGCTGSSEIYTPNLDRLAASGLRFDNFFCCSPVCSPARASLLTGCMPSQHGVHDWLAAGNVEKPLPGAYGSDCCAIEYLQGITGYSEKLASSGYICGLSGKWHLGDSLHPQKGFEHWYAHQTGAGSYYGAPMIRDGISKREDGYVTDIITNDALSFLDKHGRGGRPVLCEVHYTAPTPRGKPPSIRRKPWNGTQMLLSHRPRTFRCTLGIAVHSIGTVARFLDAGILSDTMQR